MNALTEKQAVTLAQLEAEHGNAKIEWGVSSELFLSVEQETIDALQGCVCVQVRVREPEDVLYVHVIDKDGVIQITGSAKRSDL